MGLHPKTELWSRTGMTAAVAGTPAELKSWQVKQIPLQCGDDVLAVPEWYREVDVVISLPKLKTHNLTTLTCGLKNVYGIVNGPAKSRFHVKYPSPLAMSAFLVRVFGTFKPQLTIADAIVAMEGNGPAHGHPVPVGALLGSRDTVALDAVACRALRISPSAVPMIRLAAKSQLGQMDESRIECTGSGVSRLQSVKMKPSLARYLRLFPEWSFWLTPRLFQLRPHIKTLLCEKCGICADTCPKEAITKNERTGYPAINHSNCIDCFCCLESCPHTAIAARLYLANLLCLVQQSRERPFQNDSADTLLSRHDAESMCERLPAIHDKLDRFPRLSLGRFPSPVRQTKLENGFRFWIKDDGRCSEIYGGNKVRKLEYLLAASQQGREECVGCPR